MEQKDQKGFLVLIALLAESFKEEMSKERAKIYFEFLSKFELYEVTWAIKQAIRELKYFPKISELIDFIHPTQYEYVGGPSKELTSKRENQKALEYIGRMANIVKNDPKQLTEK